MESNHRTVEDQPSDVDEQMVDVDTTPVEVHSGILTMDYIKKTQIVVDDRRSFFANVLSVTVETDWCQFGNSYHLQADGAERVATRFGITWYGKTRNSPPETRRIDNEDGTYTIQKDAFFEIPLIGRSIPITGRCHSDDKFLIGQLPTDKDGNVMSGAKVKFADVDDKAMANLKGRGICAILGIKHPTEAMLVEAGIDIKNIPRVEFKKKGATDKRHATKEAEDLRLQIRKLANYRGIELGAENQPPSPAELELLKEFTTFTGSNGPHHASSYESLSAKWAQTSIGKVKKAIEAFESKQGKDQPLPWDGAEPPPNDAPPPEDPNQGGTS